MAKMKSTQLSENLSLRELPGVDYSQDELGLVHETKPAQILDALRLPGTGKIYDLDSGRWSGMPLFPAHPPFLITHYRRRRACATCTTSTTGWARTRPGWA